MDSIDKILPESNQLSSKIDPESEVKSEYDVKENTNPKYLFKEDALQKMLCHLAKYSSYPCYGYLIGEKSSKNYIITDVICGFHSPLLAPMLEASLMQIESHLTSESLNMLLGVYAGEVYNDINPSYPSMMIVEQIIRNTGHGCIVMIPYRDILSIDNIGSLQLYTRDINGWSLYPELMTISQNENVFKEIHSLIKQDDKLQLICDFDCHLEDPTLDWIHNTQFKNGCQHLKQN